MDLKIILERTIISATWILIYGTSSYASVMALSGFLSIGTLGIIMGSGFEMGKFVSLIYVHKNWKKKNKILYLYVFIAMPLIFLTASDLMGYLSYYHQRNIQPVKSLEKELLALKKEKVFRQKQVDLVENNLKALPLQYVTKRESARNSTSYKQNISRITEIMERERDIATNYKVKTEAGPLYSTAELLSIPLHLTAKYYIVFLVIVWETLSTALSFAVIAVWKSESRTNDKENKEDDQEQEVKKIEADEGKDTESLLKERNKRLFKIMKDNNLDISEIEKITGRKSSNGTVEKWLRDEKEVPKKALRNVEKYIEIIGGK